MQCPAAPDTINRMARILTERLANPAVRLHRRCAVLGAPPRHRPGNVVQVEYPLRP